MHDLTTLNYYDRTVKINCYMYLISLRHSRVVLASAFVIHFYGEEIDCESTVSYMYYWFIRQG